jgi:hypothetical protein
LKNTPNPADTKSYRIEHPYRKYKRKISFWKLDYTLLHKPHFISQMSGQPQTPTIEQLRHSPVLAFDWTGLSPDQFHAGNKATSDWRIGLNRSSLTE